MRSGVSFFTGLKSDRCDDADSSEAIKTIPGYAGYREDTQADDC
jgi:hypothetical protein